MVTDSLPHIALISGSEFFGRAHFEHPAPPSLDILNKHFQDLDQDYTSVHIPYANGEWLKELHERVTKALTRIVTDLDNDAEQPRTLLICTHAATMVSTRALNCLKIVCTVDTGQETLAYTSHSAS